MKLQQFLFLILTFKNFTRNFHTLIHCTDLALVYRLNLSQNEKFQKKKEKKKINKNVNGWHDFSQMVIKTLSFTKIFSGEEACVLILNCSRKWFFLYFLCIGGT